MQVSLARQIRTVLDGASDALSLDELLVLVDDFVVECSSSEEPHVLISYLEDDLQATHHQVVDYSDLRQAEIFLTILHRLSPVIPSTSTIAWFEIVFRPALREPKLATVYINLAKELIIKALKKNYAERVAGFRKRLFDYYLLDVFNENSVDDVLEWAGMDETEQRERACWKDNLEDILIKYGQEHPEELFTEILTRFANPSARLQLFTLLNALSSQPSYNDVAQVLSKHVLLRHILLSISLDNSATVCSAGLTFLVKSLPYIAVYDRERLRFFIPRLLGSLARVLTWKERYPTFNGADNDPPDQQLERELVEITHKRLHVRPDFKWQRLEMTFSGITSHIPDPRPFFSMLYYLYPSNVLKFLRGPVEYLISYNLDSPYMEGWNQALDEDEIRRKSENLLREHICHPLLIWKDGSSELSISEFWAGYPIQRIATEAMMMDVRKLAAGLREKYGYATSNDVPLSVGEEQSKETDLLVSERETDQLPQQDNPPKQFDNRSRFISPIDLSKGKVVISLAEMEHTTNALRTNIDVDVETSDVRRIGNLTSRPSSPSKTQRLEPQAGDEDAAQMSVVAQAISASQREILLLRNELNFELWIQRENVKHIGRLYQDRILMRSAEAERQGLYNKLRKYRSQVKALEDELRQHKEQASSARNKYAEWNAELQKKLKELREEKKTWMSESATLRGAEKKAMALFAAQAKLLAGAANHVIELQTRQKENQHKIDRLRDYERQIEQHIKIQKLWDEDYAKFNARDEEVATMRNEMQQLRLLLQSYEKTQEKLEEDARTYRRQLQTSEAKLALSNKKAERRTLFSEQDLRAFVAEKVSLKENNTKLLEENAELRDETEELRAMVELLKAQHMGKQGIVS
ncbi:hypothetical protein AGABI1DRAFT_118451 [Agaricus bisporus var. burnettii JB137-S8]|uniref:Tuberous sclerosis 1 n=1 Tax=Agaricus bisporus var. burnettii (strain JB137-S8 / ATCC MYA-4627 / FGSC 10392) TaxID=597362 RepID=K5XIA9_AGABU|nr:uncharacterized protein AGABI1DRAFT_118451 [Agaricus bisporus var. burnettii JB137-S8]EKM83057.1 hypothetical protein AGABI1DRAFT_118451 [Agaricus bisporus var. burnettii JB137-S8]